jgi:hypothetical protein
MATNSKKYLITGLPDSEGWSWERYSVDNLSDGSDDDVFYFVSALGQGLGHLEFDWKQNNNKGKENILGWLDSCLIHSFRAMLKTKNRDRSNLFSGLVSFLMNYIECFRMQHKLPSSDVVVRIWAESLKKKETL